MVRKSYVAAAAAFTLLSAGPVRSDDEAYLGQMRDKAGTIRDIERNVAIAISLRDEKRLVNLAKEALATGRNIAATNDLTLTNYCASAAFRLSGVAIESAQGSAARLSRRDFSTLMPLCEQGVKLDPPASPNLR